MMTATWALWGLVLSAHAEEGMWTPEQVPARAAHLTDMGLALPAASLADPTAAPLSAIVSLGFCSASFVSPDGLLATNHHCVESFLQYNATAEANRARDGYLSASRAAELSAGPTARIYVLERIDDVTATVQATVSRRMGDGQRQAALERVEKSLVATCEAEAPGRRCRVASFYEGLSYRLIVQQEIRDVRLVYAPPRSVGSYGGEVDNWMWPRHTGDFSLLRAYVAPDGSMADYAEENVPYRPAHHLPLATAGVGPGDFVMVAGFPGSTRRHDRLSELRHAAEVSYPARLDLFGQLLAVFEDHADRSEEAAAKLGSPIMSLSNVDKNNRELLAMLETSGLLEQKAAEEAALDAWIAADRRRQRAYGGVIPDLEAVIAQQQALSEQSRLAGTVLWIPDLLGVAHRAYRNAVEREKPDLERESGYQDRDQSRIRAGFERLERSLYLPADRDAFAVVLRDHAAQPEAVQIPPLRDWIARQGGIDEALERLYAEPVLAATPARLALLDASVADLEASTDPWIELAVALEGWLAVQRVQSERLQGTMSRLRPRYAAALLEQRGAGALYPDANSTLRLTFGHVEGWSPADGIEYRAQTTLAGMAAKATGMPPFDAPAEMLARVPDGPASRWADPALGDVPVNYLSTLDITGGNSGSATMNARGEFVGLAFDGNVESIGADWMFADSARTIHVDVRYLLWTLEGLPDAAWLLQELGVSAPPRPE